MRVVFLSWRDLAHPQAGGSEVVIDRLARELELLGHEVALICGGPVGNREYRVVESGGRYLQYLKAPALHWRHFRDWDLTVDVSNGIPFFAPLWQRKPVLCWMHHIHEDQWSQHFPPPVARTGQLLEHSVVPRVYSRCGFVAASPSTAVGLEKLGISPEAIRVIPPGIDLPAKRWQRSPSPLFVAVGRLVPHKRIELLLRSWEEVRPSVGGRLMVIGEGPELDRYRHEARPGVVFTGRVSEAEKQRILGQAWLLLHTAQHEGWGLVITEAAAAATPALAFDVPGVRDSVIDGTTGELVTQADQFVSSWIRLAQDPVLRARLGSQAEAHAAQFTWSSAATQVAEFALEVVGDENRHHGPVTSSESEG